MIDVEPLIQDRLDRRVPRVDPAGADWNDVRRRAGADPSSRRRSLLALTAAVGAGAAIVATPLGGAIARGVGDFSAWLSGVPGKPADRAEQEAFERANSRSWSAFPDGPKLRTLIETELAGRRYELFGFRSGGSFCLRLVARGLNGSPVVSCAPSAELRGAAAPALVVLADHPFGLSHVIPVGRDYVAPASSATFGVVADGVDAVELVTDHGKRRAIVRSNAFVSISARPEVGERVRKVFSLTAGRRVAVPFVSAPFGTWDTAARPAAKPTGPSQVERTIRGGRIGWLDRRELRGEAVPDNAPYAGSPMVKGFEFARLLTPDPESHMRVLVGIGTLGRYGVKAGQSAVCSWLISGGGGGGGCQSLAELFPRGPFSWSQALIGGGHQFETISGLASDDVARMEIFFATGERRPVPLRDNAFLVEAARAKYPLRLVAYDVDGRIVAVETFLGDAATGAGPRPVGRWQTILTARDEQGNEARLRIAPSSAGGICHEFRLPGGAGGGGCVSKDPRRPKLAVGFSPGWLTGTVAPAVAAVELRFADGARRRVTPTRGFVLVPLPSALSLVVGFDARGRTVAQRSFRRR
jgi:hypothetical protein